MSKVQIKLTYPVEYGGETYHRLEMRRPTVLDAMTRSKMKGSALETEIKLFANLCEVDEKVIHLLDEADDYVALLEVYNGFFTSKRAS